MNSLNFPEHVDWDEYFMRQVYVVAIKSKDTRTKIGTVLVKDKRVISQGFNDLPIGLVHSRDRYERPLKHFLICHSEINSIFNCARHGISSIGAICYSQGISCNSCSLALIQGGIKELVVHRQWEERSGLSSYEPWRESVRYSREMFEELGIKIRYYDKVLGVQGFCDGKVVNV